MKARLIFHAIAILALTAMVVFAQEPTGNAAKSAQQSSAQGNRPDGRDANSQTRRHSDRVAGEFGTDTQVERPRVTPHQAFPVKNSAHVPEPLSTPDAEAKGNPQGSPVEKEGKSSDQVQTPGTMQEKPDVNGSQTATPRDENNPKRHRPGDGSSPN